MGVMLAGNPGSGAHAAELATAWLLTYLAHSTVLLGATALVTRKWVRSHDWRDLLWKTALFGSLLTASLQASLPFSPLTGRLHLRPVAGPSALLAADHPPAAAASEAATTNRSEVVEATFSSDPASVPARPLSFPASGVEPAGGESGGRAWSGPGVALGLWLLMAAWLLLRLGYGRLRLAIRLGERKRLLGSDLNRMVDRLRTSTGVRRRITLTVTRSLSSPLALGWREICVPEAALTDLDPEQQEAMLAHELAHLARFDPFFFTVAGFLERVFCFQPLNRLARRRLQEAAEYRADDWAVRRTGAGLDLAKCLAKVAEWIETAPVAAPIAGMAEDRSHLVARVRRLIEEGAMTSRSRTRILFPSAVAILGATVLVLPGVSPAAAARSDRVVRMADPPARPATAAASPDADLDVAEVGDLPAVAPAPKPPSAPAAAPPVQVPDTLGVVSALIAAINDPDVEVRRAVVEGLGNYRDPRALPALTAALKDADARVRSGAIEALSELKDTGAAPAIAGLIHDESVDVRRAAADALANLETPGAVDPLLEALADSDAEVRSRAADGLGDLHDRRAVPALIKALSDRSSEVRERAARSLGDLEDPRAADPLGQALASDADPEVRSAAIDALHDLEVAAVPAAVLDALRDPNADVRQSAARMLGDHQDARAVPLLRQLLEDKEADVREAAVEALGEIRSADAITALVAALKSKDPTVRKAAAEALGQK